MLRAPMSVTRIWIILIALTMVSVFTGESRALGIFSDPAIIILGSLKAQWVVLDYMEARHVPGPWLVMFEAWLAAVAFVMCWIVLAT